MYKKIFCVLFCFLAAGCTDKMCIITNEISMQNGVIEPTKIGLRFGEDCDFAADSENITIANISTLSSTNNNSILVLNLSNNTSVAIESVEFADVTEARLKNLSERDEINRIKIINKEE
jgi:hypothetical protein